MVQKFAGDIRGVLGGRGVAVVICRTEVGIFEFGLRRRECARKNLGISMPQAFTP